MGIGSVIEKGVELGAEAIGSIFGRHEQRKADDAAIKLNLEREQIAEQNRSLQRTQRLNEILANQTARASASGFSPSSASLFAINKQSINNFVGDENADAINLSYDKIEAAHQMKNERNKEIFGDIGSIFGAGKALFEGHYSTGKSHFGEQFNPTDTSTEGPDPAGEAL